MRLVKIIKPILQCDWGLKYQVKDTETGKFNGESAPLWKNSSPGCFLFQSIFSFLLVISVLSAYVIEISGLDDTCTIEYKPRILIILAMVFISGILDFIYYRIKYAADDLWFRLLTLMFIQTLSLLAIAGFSFLSGLYVLLGLGETCYNIVSKEQPTTNPVSGKIKVDLVENQIPVNAFSKEIWMANFFISAITLLIVLAKLFMIILLIKNFYWNTSKYITIASKPPELKFVD